MIICLANKKDCFQIAKIHCKEIKKGFLSQLGEKFLSKLYEAMATSKFAFVMVAKDKGRVVGIISGCINIDKFYRDFFKKYFFKISLILFPKIFKISILRKIFETLKYPKQKNKELPKAELLTVAVSADFQGEGVAEKLFKGFLNEIKKRKVKQFKVVVGEELGRAIRFYEKVGFQLHSSISIHKNKQSRIYIFTL